MYTVKIVGKTFIVEDEEIEGEIKLNSNELGILIFYIK